MKIKVNCPQILNQRETLKKLYGMVLHNSYGLYEWYGWYCMVVMVYTYAMVLFICMIWYGMVYTYGMKW